MRETTRPNIDVKRMRDAEDAVIVEGDFRGTHQGLWRGLPPTGRAVDFPVLIVFEDAHWIDPTSQDLLDRMVACAAHLPLLLIVTTRPEAHPTWVGAPQVTMVHLNRLGRPDSAAIIGGALV